MRKYITTVDGRLAYNPEWQQLNSTTAMTSGLPVIHTPEELMALGVPVPKPLSGVIEEIQGAEYTNAFNFRSGQDVDQSALEGLSTVFERNAIPIGLLGHVAALRHYNLCFLIDDSGSMTYQSDLPAYSTSGYMAARLNRNSAACVTRWQDAEDRLHQMIDLLAYVPTGPITLRFLNSTKVVMLEHRGKTFEEFKQEAHKAISDAFTRVRPSNGTPLFEKMYEVVNGAASARTPVQTAFYIMTDGQPNGGAVDIARIQALLLGNQSTRNNNNYSYYRENICSARTENAQLFPVTFIDCTNDPRQTEWTREIEEESEAGNNKLYVAAVEDWIDESRQVTQFQGIGFPYNRGLWLLTCLVGALDPDGLDAMDQAEPLTKSVFDCLLGRVHSESEYRYYFEQHAYAMRFFKEDYDLFLQAKNESEIPSVLAFRRILAVGLQQDIEEGDDNSELREIENAGAQMLNQRNSGRFATDNRLLRAAIAQRVYQQWGTERSNPIPTAADSYAYPTKPIAGYIPQQSGAVVTGTISGGGAFTISANAAVIIPRSVEWQVLRDLAGYIAKKRDEYVSSRFFRDTHRDKWHAAAALLQFINAKYVMDQKGWDQSLMKALLENHGFPRGDSNLRALAIRTLGRGNVLELDTQLSQMKKDDVLVLGDNGVMRIINCAPVQQFILGNMY